MNRGKILLGLALAALPGTTLAQSAGDGFKAKGYISLAYLDFSNGSSDFAILGDGDFGVSFGAFGADFSVITYETDGDGETKVFGGLSYTFGNEASVVVGSPRSAFDRYGKFNIGDTSRYYGTTWSGSDKSLFSDVGMNASVSHRPYGVRFDSRTDDSLRYSVSLLYEDQNEEYALGGSVEFVNGPTTYSGGLEYITDGSGSGVTQTKLMIEQELNVFTFGGAASYLDDGSDQVSYLEGSVVWEPVDMVDVTGFAAWTDTLGNNQMLYGVGGKYFFDRGANVGASATHTEDNTLYEFSVGLDF